MTTAQNNKIMFCIKVYAHLWFVHMHAYRCVKAVLEKLVKNNWKNKTKQQKQSKTKPTSIFPFPSSLGEREL